MRPFLLPKDVIYYHKVTFRNCCINDIVLIKKNSLLLTHRIIYKNKYYLITKGDNNLKSDGKIYPKQIIAKAYRIKRNGQIFSHENLYLLQSTLYFQEIVKVKKAFEREKIDFVFLKGLPLHLYYEKSHPRRLYADTDILIKRTQAKTIEQILIELGYRETIVPLANIGPIFKGNKDEFSFIKKINNIFVVIDVHTEAVFTITKIGNLNSLYPRNYNVALTDRLLNEKIRVTINGQIFPILNANNLFIYLALHFFNHNFHGSFRLELIEQLIRKSNIDWEKVAELINKYKLNNFIYPVIIFIKRYYKTKFSTIFINSINNTKIKNVSSILKINIFDNESRIQAGINRFKNLFFLSPNPLWIRLFIFFNFRVLYSIIWVTIRKINSKIS